MVNKTADELLKSMPEKTYVYWNGDSFCAKVPSGRTVFAFGKTILEALELLETKLDVLQK